MGVGWVFLTVLLAVLSACTYRREVHETERAVLKTPPCKPEVPIVGLAPATDARASQVITSYMGYHNP